MSDAATATWPDHLLTLPEWDALFLDELHHVECAEGVLIVTPKPLPRHQHAMTNLVQMVNAALPENLVALADVEVLLAAEPLTVRAPDVVVAHRAAAAADPPRLAVDSVVLAVEITSAGSRRTGRVTKLSEYAEAGIAEYWIVDIDDPAALEVHRLGSDGRYHRIAQHRGEAVVEVCGVGCGIDLNRLGRI